MNAELVDPSIHKIWVVSATNLLPMHPGSQQVRLQMLPRVLEELDVSVESRSFISDPQGVLLAGLDWDHTTGQSALPRLLPHSCGSGGCIVACVLPTTLPEWQCDYLEEET